jgi:SAM-dependent methyltransferase
MPREYMHARWGALDETADPSAFVQYLEAVETLDTVQRVKRRSYELLGLREGDRVLDVGCGLGEDVRALAERVGKTGRAVGLDSSRTMIAQARRRIKRTDLSVEFCVGDAQRLEFADGSFDGCRAERLFVHLRDPVRALTEMVRVTRAGGQVVAYDADWETLAVDAQDRLLTRKVLNFFCDSSGSRWIGRQLRGLFLEAGLVDVALFPETLMFTTYVEANRVFKLQEIADHAQAAGVMSAQDAGKWIGALKQADDSGRFFAAVTGFCVQGRKPS